MAWCALLAVACSIAHAKRLALTPRKISAPLSSRSDPLLHAQEHTSNQSDMMYYYDDRMGFTLLSPFSPRPLTSWGVTSGFNVSGADFSSAATGLGTQLEMELDDGVGPTSLLEEQSSAEDAGNMSMPDVADVAFTDLHPSSGKQQDAEFQRLAPLASMIQESAAIKHKLTTAFNSAKVVMSSCRRYINLVPQPILWILLGAGLFALFHACRRTLLHMLLGRSSRTRVPHYHQGRVVYEWDQTPEMAIIYIRPPENLKKNDFEIKIGARHLRVGRKGKPAFLREETHDLVNEKRSSWSLRSNGELQIFLRKVRKAEWPTVLLHSEQSDSSSFVSSKMNSMFKLPLSCVSQQEK